MGKIKNVFILTAVIGVLVAWMAWDRYKEKQPASTSTFKRK